MISTVRPRQMCGHVALDDGFGFIVQGAGGLVKDQDARVAEQGARNGNALALAPAERGPLLAHRGVVALGQLADELVCARQAGGGHDGLQRRGGVANGDVLAHAAVEQEVVLQDDPDLATQLGRIHQADVDAVDQQAALLGRVQALHQLGQRALAGTAAAHDAHDLTGPDVQAHAVQHGRGLGPVAKGDLVQRDAALDGGQLGGVAGGHLGAGVEDVAQAVHGNAGLLKVGPHLRHAHDGLGHAPGKHVEGHKLPHRQLMVHDQLGAVPERCGIDHLADQVDASWAQVARFCVLKLAAT